MYAAREQLTRGFLDDTAGPPWRRGADLDAVSAAKNLEVIEVQARASSANIVTSVSIDLDEIDEISTYDVDEVHVKSLVRGAGPLRGARGLLARSGTKWVLVDNDVAPQLRRD